MKPIRRLIACPHLAALLCAATLLLRLLVPAGYMIGGAPGHVTIELCPGTVSMAMPMAMAGMHDAMPGHDGADRHHADYDRAEMPCAFAGLAAATLGAVDPVQLAALIAFVMATGIVAILLPPRLRPARLRPPLRGPPARL